MFGILAKVYAELLGLATFTPGPRRSGDARLDATRPGSTSPAPPARHGTRPARLGHAPPPFGSGRALVVPLG
jgi:hypothetical protein